MRPSLKKRIRYKTLLSAGLPNIDCRFSSRWGAGCRRKIKYREQLIDGLDRAPQALIGLLKARTSVGGIRVAADDLARRAST